MTAAAGEKGGGASVAASPPLMHPLPALHFGHSDRKGGISKSPVRARLHLARPIRAGSAC